MLLEFKQRQGKKSGYYYPPANGAAFMALLKIDKVECQTDDLVRMEEAGQTIKITDRPHLPTIINSHR